MSDWVQTCQRVVLIKLKPSLAWNMYWCQNLAAFDRKHQVTEKIVACCHPHVAIVIGGCATFSSTRQNFTSKEVVKVYKCYKQMSNSTVVDMGQQRKMDLCLVLVTRLKNIWGKEVESLLLRRRTKAESNTMWTTRKGMVFCRKKVSAPGIFTGTIKWNLYKTLLLHESEGKSITVIAEQGCETTCFNRAGTKQ